MAASNGNAPPLPSPSEFSMLVAACFAAHAHMLDPDGDATGEARAFEAARMLVIETYERAYGR
jgi:hypothetical protein